MKYVITVKGANGMTLVFTIEAESAGKALQDAALREWKMRSGGK